ncbi:MAG TPA: hypothetical protein VG322_07365 [Candidatus Acidoferrales bacterium]|nr:hypothetical protein [Candidatus Acidoferrales bacterium]
MLRGPRTVLSFPHVFEFLADELARLGGWRFPFFFVSLGPLNYFFFWHGHSSTAEDNLPQYLDAIARDGNGIPKTVYLLDSAFRIERTFRLNFWIKQFGPTRGKSDLETGRAN